MDIFLKRMPLEGDFQTDMSFRRDSRGIITLNDLVGQDVNIENATS